MTTSSSGRGGVGIGMRDPGGGERSTLGGSLPRAGPLGIRTRDPGDLDGGMPDSSTIVGVLVYDGCVHINDGDGVGTTTSYVIGNSSGVGIDRGGGVPSSGDGLLWGIRSIRGSGTGLGTGAGGLGGVQRVARRQIGHASRLHPRRGRLRRAFTRRRHTNRPGGRVGSMNQRGVRARRKATTAWVPPSGGPQHGRTRTGGA
jgi:hypothetical protein